MKKIVLSSIVLLVSIFVSAQTTFGVKAGANISNFIVDIDGADAKIGLYAGGYANIKFSEKFAFQPEILYSLQGSKSSFSYDIYTIDERIDLHYVNIPLMFKYYFIERFNVELGPQVGFLVNAKYKVSGSNIPYFNSVDDLDVTDEFKTIDFGLNIGAGYALRNGLNFGIRYNLGLTNINDTEGEKIQNSVFSFGVGYTF